MSGKAPMRRFNTVMLALPLHGVQLSALLFLEYLGSGTFRGDMAEAVCDFSALLPLLRSRSMKSIQSLTLMYASMLRDRFLFRAMECAVASACVYGTNFTKDAVVFHYLLPLIQEYRFSRSFVTRTLRAVGRVCYPAFLRRMVFGPPADPEDNPDVAYVQNPPKVVKGEDIYATMPEGVRDALQYYTCHHRAHPFYAVAASSFVQEVSRVALESCLWGGRFLKEREKPDVSKWRLLKPFLSYCAVTGTQISLTVLVRGVAATVAAALSSEPTGGGIFWMERIGFLIVAPAINIISETVGVLVRDMLEQAHPTTTEDSVEDEREKKQQEEEVRNSGFYFFEAANAAGNPQDRERFKKGVDFYLVLGVDEKAQAAEVKKAYRQLALKNHPDRAGRDALAQQNARENMAIINEAYDVLINEQTRMQYDASRMFADSPNILKYLEGLSVAQFVAVGAGASLGLFLLLGAAVYSQYCTLYQTVTATGRQPLSLFNFEFSPEAENNNNNENNR
ncbi:DnaJ domain containing protein, putative [Angomonas deanei]|uniref:DnaJ domain containing protein, putative n=1 Tax=Angomonas deanei TaxID=59799 RepID=A0A7G2CAM0_9TRYP|nr:DnaJ domain containing protein, putative [Angomonas deanei]